VNDLSILTLGPSYSHADLATGKYLYENNLSAEVKLLTPINKSEGVIEELVRCYENGNYNIKAIVPILNTIEGRVKDTLAPGRGLLKYPKVQICDEYWLEIKQCLAGKGSLKDIQKVFSHPQALGQCTNSLRKLNVKTSETTSTSKAAEIASKDETGKVAAICSEEAASEYGLNILARDIADKLDESSENYTRFWVLSHKDAEPTGKDKTTLTMELYGADQPAVLYKAIEPFALSRINLSKIESMEKGSRTENIFWLDVDEHRENMKLELSKLKPLTKWLNVHGSYPICPRKI